MRKVHTEAVAALLEPEPSEGNQVEEMAQVVATASTDIRAPPDARSRDFYEEKKLSRAAGAQPRERQAPASAQPRHHEHGAAELARAARPLPQHRSGRE